MKKNNLTRGAFAVLLLVSNVAGADQQYPAADFQPEVLYQDSDYIAKNSPSSAKASAHTAKTTSNTVESNEVDSKYPAANFQPEVLYHDPNYKPSESARAVSSREISSSSVETKSATAASVNKEESSMQSYLIGLVILAVAGFYFFKKQSTATVKKTAPLPARTSSYALTGVSKYLNKVSGTGVSRYLEKHVKSPAATTGVAKYMAKKAVSPKTTAAQAATGVEKYMRDRG